MKKYLICIVTTKTGKKFNNPLKLGEVVLISKLVKEHESVLVKLDTCTEAQYKAMFG